MASRLQQDMQHLSEVMAVAARVVGWLEFEADDVQVSVCLSVCLSSCLSVCLPVFVFVCLFARTCLKKKLRVRVVSHNQIGWLEFEADDLQECVCVCVCVRACVCARACVRVKSSQYSKETYRLMHTSALCCAVSGAKRSLEKSPSGAKRSLEKSPSGAKRSLQKEP
jgi:hypothetical protein